MKETREFAIFLRDPFLDMEMHNRIEEGLQISSFSPEVSCSFFLRSVAVPGHCGILQEPVSFFIIAKRIPGAKFIQNS